MWIGDGSGSFTAATGGPTLGSAGTRAVAFADFNGDGALDLFVVNSGDANEVWHNALSGSFTAATGGPTEGSRYTASVTLGDVNGDGVRVAGLDLCPCLPRACCYYYVIARYLIPLLPGARPICW